MMDRVFKQIFAMRYIAMGLFVFLIAIGAATFLESLYGIQTARILVYNATWFTLLLVYLCFGLISNIINYRMFQREKIATLSFHLAFLIIMIGAAITRYYSFEGQMIIREGTTVDYILTGDPHLLVYASDGKKDQTEVYNHFMSPITNNNFEHEMAFGNKVIEINYVDFKSRAIDTVILDKKEKGAVLDIVVGGMKSNYVGEKEIFLAGSIPIAYNAELNQSGVKIKKNGSDFLIKTNIPLRYLAMTEMQKARQTGAPIPDSAYTQVALNQWEVLKTRTLYQSGQEQFVVKQIIQHARKTLYETGVKNKGADYLTVEVKYGKDSKIVRLEGGLKTLPEPKRISLDGLLVQLEYGSIRMPLPFAVGCKSFTLKTYPGSESPSSFESEIRIIDKKNNYTSDRKVFMNNVTDYSGFRFFQSSYDLDNPQTPENEEGTRLSVNHDWLGTNITYLGYLLMGIGMVLSLFSRTGRFKDLNNKLNILKSQREKVGLFIALFALSFTSYSQEHSHNNESKTDAIYRIINEEHSAALASLLIQNYEGRIVPFHSLCDELLRKVHGGKTYNEYNAVQTVISMHMYPNHWMNEKVISIPSALRERLKLKPYASTLDLTSKDGNFKWLKEYKIAHQKLESKRDEFDKKLIILIDRFEVMNLIFTWQYMRIIPKIGDQNNKWFIPMDMELMKVDSLSSQQTLQYLSAIDKAATTGGYGTAEDLLNQIKKFQRKAGAAVVPSEGKVKIEISYNNMEIFKNTWMVYILAGMLLLIVFYLSVFFKIGSKITKIINLTRKTFFYLLLLVFIYHGAGLGMRWYISGHAPWSNGYEAVIFIAWVTMLAGFLFSKKNEIVLPGTAILAAMMIIVSEMNLLNPQITPLVPVLKSYWLMIHVAIITGSYGFLGLACILGLLNLILYIFRGDSNGKVVTRNISELTYISEMTMTIGVFMLTVGTFLGGVWANESWGRYWGWDPKETWALVSVLVYAIILHLRYIPGLKSKFVFNVVSFWGYSAILFTFFGVNFMLVGLHSYAQGDGLGKFPVWLTITIVLFFLLTLLAAIMNRKFNSKNSSNKAPLEA
jgi:cytochrome c-type biogenesis protein CcsB